MFQSTQSKSEKVLCEIQLCETNDSFALERVSCMGRPVNVPSKNSFLTGVNNLLFA